MIKIRSYLIFISIAFLIAISSLLPLTINSTPNAPTITNPVANDIVIVGGELTITWTGFNCNDVSINLYVGTSYWNTISDQTPNDGSYAWTVDSRKDNNAANDHRIDDSFKIYIYCYDTSSDNAYSPSFTISNPVVTDPQAGDTLYKGDSYYILTGGFFSTTGTVELYRGSTFVETITTTYDFSYVSYQWTVPNSLTDATNYRIKIISNSDIDEYAFSGYFTIKSKETSTSTATSSSVPATSSTTTSTPVTTTTSTTNQIISITSTTVWTVSTTVTIKWSLSGASYVAIYLYKHSTSILTITTSTYNDGTYRWTVSSSLTTSSYYRIKVVSTSSSSNYVYSDYFTIKGNSATSTSSISTKTSSTATKTSSDNPPPEPDVNESTSSLNSNLLNIYTILFTIPIIYIYKRRKNN